MYRDSCGYHACTDHFDSRRELQLPLDYSLVCLFREQLDDHLAILDLLSIPGRPVVSTYLLHTTNTLHCTSCLLWLQHRLSLTPLLHNSGHVYFIRVARMLTSFNPYPYIVYAPLIHSQCISLYKILVIVQHQQVSIEPLPNKDSYQLCLHQECS